MSTVFEGVGPNTPTVTNQSGGKQSMIPYRFDLLPAKALADIAKVLDQGARKYGENNWRKIHCPDHLNHALVHIFAWLAGDTQDNHLEHAGCRILMALEQKETYERFIGKLIDQCGDPH